MTATAPAPTYTPVPIGDLCEFLNGGTPSKANVDFWDGDIPWITSAEINDGEVAPPRFKITQDAIDESSTRLVPAGTLLLVIRTGVGKVGIAPYDLTFNQDINAVLPDPKRLDKQYLRRFLESQGDHFEKFSRGATVKGITREHLGRLAIPIPFPDDPRRSLAEQKRIAAILDKADAIRRRRQEAARLADTLIPSVFYEMFGRTNAELQRWPMSPLGEYIVEGPQNGLYRPASEYGSGTRIVRIDSFYHGELCHLDQLKRVRLEDDTIQKWLLRSDDLLINRVNSTEFLGKSAIVPEHNEPMVFESNMMRFRVDTDRLAPRFLIAMLQTRLIKGQILKKERPAVNQSSINQDDVKGLKVPTPPIELQRDFAKRVPAMQRQRDAQPPRAEAADTLFNSLVQRAFRGEL